ncbi:MAG: Na+/H+ antiporter subunit E [Myxococcota bacterium]|nr:Na+/H+ antiporter subunit E [Myxococcota bacterium]
MSGSYRKKQLVNLGRLVVFGILFAFWLLFSGKFDVFHLSLGILCCALVAFVSHDLLIRDMAPHNRLKKGFRFVGYVPWLIYQVLLANFHVAYLVLKPSAIHPRIVRYTSTLKSDFSIVTFANSITLTPGTITMDIIDGEYYVHALSKKVADDLESGDMERRVADVFLETPSGK